jgi:hypothetical protein
MAEIMHIAGAIAALIVAAIIADFVYHYRKYRGRKAEIRAKREAIDGRS